MYYSKSVSVVLPTYREKKSIKKVINDFYNLRNGQKKRLVDEIVVVNNNAEEGTSREIESSKAKEVFEHVQGYGSAIQHGLKVANGDLIVICEPDDTFLAGDIYKFLSFSDDVDIVYGSRTIKSFIWSGAKMGFFLRWGNWFVAKMIEILFDTNYLSDVGCTYRLVKKDVAKKMLPRFNIKSNFFSPEMIVLGFQMHYKCVQIPVNYKVRIGESTITSNFKNSFMIGFKMILLILAMRFKLIGLIKPLFIYV